MWQKEILPLASKIVKEEKIDLVHHVTFNEFRTPGKLYNLACPFVWGPIGGGQFYNPIFKNAYFSKKDIIKEIVRNHINRLYLLFSKDIHMAVKKASTVLIADQSTEKIMPTSREYVRLLETAYNLNRNGIKDYGNLDESKLNRPLRLLWVGGIWPRKGLKLIIDALKDSDFSEYTLHIIGDGQDKKACEKLVKNYGLQDKIYFLGSLPYDKVNEQYDKADVFIFTSLRDTSGNVVLEAMSHGLPVITINHHGAGEIVTDETGIRINPTSYDGLKKSFVEGIKTYANTPSLLYKHGIAARKRIESVYSWEQNVKVMKEVYEKAIER